MEDKHEMITNQNYWMIVV